jgi:hypothetical protein
LDSNGKFNIIQLGDLMHDGGDYSATEDLIRNLIKVIDPQLIVITGDTVDPSRSRDWEKLHKEAMDFIVKSDIPWLWTGGSNIDGLTRDQMLGIDQQMNFQNSWSGYKWNTHTSDAKYSDEQLGEFTARIPVMAKGGSKEVLSVYAFDTEMFECSNSLNLPGTNCIGSDAVTWFAEQ